MTSLKHVHISHQTAGFFKNTSHDFYSSLSLSSFYQSSHPSFVNTCLYPSIILQLFSSLPPPSIFHLHLYDLSHPSSSPPLHPHLLLRLSPSLLMFPSLPPSTHPSLHPVVEATDKTQRRIPPLVLPFKWILTQLALIPHYPLIVLGFFFHPSIHPFIPAPSFMTRLSADINQLREKIPHHAALRCVRSRRRRCGKYRCGGSEESEREDITQLPESFTAKCHAYKHTASFNAINCGSHVGCPRLPGTRRLWSPDSVCKHVRLSCGWLKSLNQNKSDLGAKVTSDFRHFLPQCRSIWKYERLSWN